jgi:molybdate transport system substrate-binding protein
MAYLQQKNLIQAASQVNLLGNQLVLIAPKSQPFNAKMRLDFNLATAFDGKLCTGDTNSVPAGIYAKQALQYFSWWETIKPRIVAMQDVRAALVSVERGECAAGIVYATDAKASSKVRVVADFPANSHAEIVYPLALVKNANPYAHDFYQFLMSDQARQIFNQYGFTTISIDKRQ